MRRSGKQIVKPFMLVWEGHIQDILPILLFQLFPKIACIKCDFLNSAWQTLMCMLFEGLDVLCELMHPQVSFF